MRPRARLVAAVLVASAGAAFAQGPERRFEFNVAGNRTVSIVAIRKAGLPADEWYTTDVVAENLPAGTRRVLRPNAPGRGCRFDIVVTLEGPGQASHLPDRNLCEILRIDFIAQGDKARWTIVMPNR